uniref:NADH-ubiquinone oxidoreductase chain 4 n=1 Tax=Duthiersia expansa TaxID=2015383 RepID=A0A8F7GLS8_9CEST|nr:NADH dehydrogenase subunit 4 [Duthiersia expansa]
MSMYNFISFGFFLSLSFVLLMPLLFSIGLGGIHSLTVMNGYFIFDSLSFYLIILVFFLGVYGMLSTRVELSGVSILFLVLSLVFTGLCFCVNHAILFWCLYELSILPLLLLIFVDSPYSERFIAGWYFAVYLLVTSLPLILLLLYLSFLNGSLFFSDWEFCQGHLVVYLTLSFVFFTKVPLCPFHTWLPIVHAEATSIVSIFLSGYIMKLGLLGVYRCAPHIFSGGFMVYLFICCVFSIFFMITAANELDGKRWLAFLSLSHILIPFLSFYVSSWGTINLSFLYCLGHGLSAGLVFGFLWLFYNITHTRNWLLLKQGVCGWFPTLLITVGLLSLCSFPPTIQFFCEVYLLSSSMQSYLYLVFWGAYLFFGGLVPLVLCGHILVRLEAFEVPNYYLHCFAFLFLYLSLWCFLGVFVL